jgi:ribose 1,5-bisphosphate isomerase
MSADEQSARAALPECARPAFDDIVNRRVLGANNHIRMIGEMIEAIVQDGLNDGRSTGEVRRRIALVTDYFIATRGVSSQAIPNALQVMTKGLDRLADDEPLQDAAHRILGARDSFAEMSRRAAELVLTFATTLLANAKTIMAFDYSSTVEKVLQRLGGTDRTVIIPESRAISGGAPYLAACTAAGYRVRFVPDVALLHELRACDAVLMGAETFFADGTGFNTIGSDLVGLACKELGVPLYFLTTFQKLDIRNVHGMPKTLPHVDLAQEDPDFCPPGADLTTVGTTIPELIGVPAEHIRAFVTELGVIPATQLWEPSVRYHRELIGDHR